MALEPLMWGLPHEVPDDAIASWGARAIDMNGYVDLLPDRQDTQGDRDRLFEVLEGMFPVATLKTSCADLPRDFVATLFDDGGLTVKVRRAGGYFYLVAYLCGASHHGPWCDEVPAEACAACRGVTA